MTPVLLVAAGLLAVGVLLAAGAVREIRLAVRGWRKPVLHGFTPSAADPDHGRWPLPAHRWPDPRIDGSITGGRALAFAYAQQARQQADRVKITASAMLLVGGAWFGAAIPDIGAFMTGRSAWQLAHPRGPASLLEVGELAVASLPVVAPVVLVACGYFVELTAPLYGRAAAIYAGVATRERLRAAEQAPREEARLIRMRSRLRAAFQALATRASGQ